MTESLLSRCFAVVLTFMLFGIPCEAATYQVVRAEITFQAETTTGDFKGRTESVRGQVHYNEEAHYFDDGELIVEAASFKTGIGMRDKHLREDFLHTEEYPVIQLRLRRPAEDALPIVPHKLDKGATGEILGVLRIKGRDKRFRATFLVEGADDTLLQVTSVFPIVITDFDIPQPRFAFVKMDTTVQVTVTLNLRATADESGGTSSPASPSEPDSAH